MASEALPAIAIVLFGTITNPNNIANEENSVKIFQRLCNLSSLLLLILKISKKSHQIKHHCEVMHLKIGLTANPFFITQCRPAAGCA